MINRRRFLQAGAGAAAFLAFSRRAYPFSQSITGISKFTGPLPGLGPTGIPVLMPNKKLFPGTDYYEIEAAQFTQQVHPAIPTTTFWGTPMPRPITGTWWRDRGHARQAGKAESH